MMTEVLDVTLENELKELIITELKIKGVSCQEIEDDSLIFGEGLGLDSLDAVELVVIVNKHYNIDIKDRKEALHVSASIKSLADFIRTHRKTD